MFNVIPNGLVENKFQVSLGQSRALDVLASPDVLLTLERLGIRYRRHSLLFETLDRIVVFFQIELSADEYDRDVGRMVVDLWEPLFHVSACCSSWPLPAHLM